MHVHADATWAWMQELQRGEVRAVGPRGSALGRCLEARENLTAAVGYSNLALVPRPWVSVRRPRIAEGAKVSGAEKMGWCSRRWKNVPSSAVSCLRNVSVAGEDLSGIRRHRGDSRGDFKLAVSRPKSRKAACYREFSETANGLFESLWGRLSLTEIRVVLCSTPSCLRNVSAAGMDLSPASSVCTGPPLHLRPSGCGTA